MERPPKQQLQLQRKQQNLQRQPQQSQQQQQQQQQSPLHQQLPPPPQQQQQEQKYHRCPSLDDSDGGREDSTHSDVSFTDRILRMFVRGEPSPILLRHKRMNSAEEAFQNIKITSQNKNNTNTNTTINNTNGNNNNINNKAKLRNLRIKSPSPSASFRKQLDSIEETGGDNDSLGMPTAEDEAYLDNDAARERPSLARHEASVEDENNNTSYASLLLPFSSDAVLLFPSGMAQPCYNLRFAPRDADSISTLGSFPSPHLDDHGRIMEEKLSQLLTGPIQDSLERDRVVKTYMTELELERAHLIAKWRAELQEELRTERQQQKSISLLSQLRSTIVQPFILPCLDALGNVLSNAEVSISNMPLTIGAVGLAWATMGVIWFKFMEEMVPFCVPVQYRSSRCHFPEFPGCFECDTQQPWYQLALRFHLFCTFVAGLCCGLFLLKTLIAWRVVADELSNPTTSTPCGVMCITLVIVFAGRGLLGECIVLITSLFHFCLAFWFLYMAIFKFRLWPDPGWFPNTVGMSYAAIKTWLYFPDTGYVLLAFCAMFFFSTFFISVIRVALNKKIATPVCWIQLSAPSITMYAFSLVSQPSHASEEQQLDASILLQSQHFETMVKYYLPFQHFMMCLSLIGLASAMHAVWTRWDKFKKVPFSPAHMAFCFPTLSHANAVQAYRGAVNTYSSFPAGSAFKRALWCYWFAFLIFGTVLNLIFTFKFVRRLPKWTKLDVSGEAEPPHPSDTILKEMMLESGAHEVLDQPFFSPAVLQANEAGSLIRVRRGTEDFRLHGPYKRTRKVTAFGFDPIMDEDELRQERAELLNWVAKHAPRVRNKTLSFSMVMDHLHGPDNRDNYGTFGFSNDSDTRTGGRQHTRSKTAVGFAGV